MSQKEISVKETSELWKQGKIKLLDVRGEEERAIASINGVPLIDQALADEMISKWPKDAAIVLHCHHGIRSLDAGAFFEEKGFTNVKSMSGGIDAWSCVVDASVPRY